MADQDPVCFVIMSFDEKYDRVFNDAIKIASEKNDLRSIRTDRARNISNIPRDIVRNIVYARIIIADLSEISANVFYELGVAHSCRKRVISITSNFEKLPFVLFDIKTFA